MEFKPSHELFHGWLLIAEPKRFPLPFQSNPGLDQEMSPELMRVWFQEGGGEGIQGHNMGEPIGLRFQTFQGALYHATSVVAPIRHKINKALEVNKPEATFSPSGNGNNPPPTMGERWERLFPPPCNAWWKSPIFHLVRQEMIGVGGGQHHHRIGRMMEPNLPYAFMYMPAVE